MAASGEGEDHTVKMRSKKITIKKFVHTEEEQNPIKFPCLMRYASTRKGCLQRIQSSRKSLTNKNCWNWDLGEDTSDSELDFDPFDPNPKPRTDKDIIRKTSTPIKTPKRLSIFHPLPISKLSPILPPSDLIDLGNKSRRNSRTITSINSTFVKKGKFGNPLLSSTKLDEKENNDRLTNAPRLNGNRPVNLSDTEEDVVTSKLLHKNAFFDALLEEIEDDEEN